MVKFIHAADIHLDSPLHRLEAYEGAPVTELRQATRRAFENLIETALTNEVDFVLIAGDLFDGDWKDYNTGLYFVAQANRLREADIPVYVAAGNHDAASRITKALRWPENVHIFPNQRPETLKIERLGVAIHGQSYPTPSVRLDMSDQYPPPLPDYYNIGMLHTCLTGDSGHEPYAPCTVAGLISKGYDYWALGHVHTHSVISTDPPVVFPGNIQGRHIRESGPKGCILVQVDDNDTASLEFLPLDVIRWQMLEVDASGCDTGFEVVDCFGGSLERLIGQNEAQPLVVRVVFQGDTAAHDLILEDMEQWMIEIRSLALTMGAGQVWVEKVLFHTQPPIGDTALERGDGAVAELLQYLEELQTDESRLSELAQCLEDLDSKLPRELKSGSEGLELSDVGWLRNILLQTRPMLIRKLLSSKGPH